MNPFRAALASLLLPALAGCADGKLPDYNKLGALRVLAIKAEPPEVDPTGNPSVTLTPIVSDLGGGRAMTYEAVGCVDPGVSLGAAPGCDGVPGKVSLGQGAVADPDPGKFTYTGEAPAFSAVVPSTIFADRSELDRFNGVAYLVVYTLIAANGDGSTTRVTSLKRISATTRAPKNANPSVADIKAGADSFATFLGALSFPPASGSVADLSVVVDPGSAETYTLLAGDGTLRTFTEQMTTTWFISDGELKRYRTLDSDSNPWTPPNDQPLGPSGNPRGIVFVAVTRDGRGGEDYRIVEK